jgi:hypothetical protein
MTELDNDTRLKIIGLKTLANDHNKRLNEIYRALCDVLGTTQEEDRGAISDFVYADSGIDDVTDLWNAVQWQKEGRQAVRAAG